MKALSFIKIKNIPGNATNSLHSGEIVVLSWNISYSKDGPHAEKPSIQDLNITKYADLASPDLILACCNSTKIDEAILSVCTSGSSAYDTMTMIMSNVYVTSISPTSSLGEEKATETISLSFEKVNIIHREKTSTGVTENSTMGWDVKNNTESSTITSKLYK